MSLLSASLATFWAHAGATAPAAGSSNAVCGKSFQQAREAAQAGRLRSARVAFTECAKSSCGASIAPKCRSGLQQLDVDTPSVIPVATDASGAQRLDVHVSVDGELLSSRIDGRSLDVDPGLHEFEFSTDDGEVAKVQLLVLEGQRNRVIPLQLTSAHPAPESADAPARPAAEPPASERPEASSPPAPAEHATPLTRAPARPDVPESARPERSRTQPILAYSLGGAGLAAVGGSFLLAHWGREDSLLLDRCAPNCSQKSVDHVSNMYIAADITLGVGVVALGAATWLYLSRPDVEDTKSAQTYRFDVQPTASGAYATLGRAF